MNTRTRTNGFTLIELLVVITIISILAAILFPVFASARAKARQTACLNNMKQIGLACLQYTQDFDENEVPQYVNYSAGGSIYWPSLLVPYTNNQSNGKGVFFCPETGDTTGSWFTPNASRVDPASGLPNDNYYCGVTSGDGSYSGYTLGVANLSYSRNVIPFNGWHPPNTFNGLTTPRFGFNGKASGNGGSITERQLEDPAGTIQIVDAMAGRKIAGSPTAGNNPCSGGGVSMPSLDDSWKTDMFSRSETVKPAYRHFDGYNAIFGDAHVKWMRWGSTTPCMWSVQADPYPSDSAAIKTACQ